MCIFVIITHSFSVCHYFFLLSPVLSIQMSLFFPLFFFCRCQCITFVFNYKSQLLFFIYLVLPLLLSVFLYLFILCFSSFTFDKFYAFLLPNISLFVSLLLSSLSGSSSSTISGSASYYLSISLSLSLSLILSYFHHSSTAYLKNMINFPSATLSLCDSVCLSVCLSLSLSLSISLSLLDTRTPMSVHWLLRAFHYFFK